MSKASAVLQTATLGLALLSLSLFGWSLHDRWLKPAVGVALPQGAAVFETSLQSRISATDTSMTLVANSVRGGGTLSGYNCFTIDEGRTDMEYVCGTVSGTSVTSLERGIDPLTASTTNTVIRFPHRVGANVKITDFPLIQRMRHQLSGSDTFDAILKYASHPTFTSITDIVDKKYVDDTAFSGAGVIDATASARGVVELATQAEAAASTASGSSGVLALAASIATSTWNSSTASQRVLLTGTNGLLDPAFLRLASSTHATTSAAIGWGALSFIVPTTAPASSTVLAFSGTSPYRMSFVEEGWTLIESTTTQAAMTHATTTAVTTASPNGFRELKVFITTTGVNTAQSLNIAFNNDCRGAGTACGYTNYFNYAVQGSGSNGAEIPLTAVNTPGATTSPTFHEISIGNPISARKLMHYTGEASSANAITPALYTGMGVWNNTSSPITSIRIYARDGGTIGAGTVITVFGRRN